MVCFIGGGLRLPDSQRLCQRTVPEQPRRFLEFKKAGGLFQHLNVLLVTSCVEAHPSSSGDVVSVVLCTSLITPEK